MMRASDLKQAQQIVDAIANIDRSLKLEIYTGRSNQISVKEGSSETWMPISPEVAVKAFEMQKALLRSRRAELVRKSNQLGLVLE